MGRTHWTNKQNVDIWQTVRNLYYNNHFNLGAHTMASRNKQPEPTQTKGGLKKVGALWLGEGKNGKYMSGRIELDDKNEMRVLVFKNSYKDQPKHPDYIIYEPEETEGGTPDKFKDDKGPL